MRVTEYFEAVRERYLGAFRREIEACLSQSRDSNDQVLLEAAISIKGEDGNPIQMPGELSLPYRCDVAVMTSDGHLQTTMVVADHDVAWRSATVAFGDLAVLVEHFVWSCCSVVARPAPPRAEWLRIRDWFVGWFDRAGEGELVTGAGRLKGAVHYMSDPTVDEDEDTIHLQLDFGSAPVKALEELLLLLGEMGATYAEVCTPEGALRSRLPMMTAAQTMNEPDPSVVPTATRGQRRQFRFLVGRQHAFRAFTGADLGLPAMVSILDAFRWVSTNGSSPEDRMAAILRAMKPDEHVR